METFISNKATRNVGKGLHIAIPVDTAILALRSCDMEALYIYKYLGALIVVVYAFQQLTTVGLVEPSRSLLLGSPACKSISK